MTEHGAQYDHIGSKYDEYAQTATLKRAESYTVLRMVGPLAGKRVLDLACGFGFYTRLLKQHGAAQVIGIDISPEMVRLGREQEQAEPLGVPTKSTTLQPSLCWAPLIWSPPFIYSTTRPAPTSCSACAAAPTTTSCPGGTSSPIR
jgi:SAM-dependent methyltransferase